MIGNAQKRDADVLDLLKLQTELRFTGQNCTFSLLELIFHKKNEKKIKSTDGLDINQKVFENLYIKMIYKIKLSANSI